MCVSRLIPPLNQLDLLRNLKNKSGLSFRSAMFYTGNQFTSKQTTTSSAGFLFIIRLIFLNSVII